jgi:hypothetical protein
MKVNHDDHQTISTNEAEEDFAALIGLDWGSQAHALFLYVCATKARESNNQECNWPVRIGGNHCNN